MIENVKIFYISKIHPACNEIKLQSVCTEPCLCLKEGEGIFVSKYTCWVRKPNVPSIPVFISISNLSGFWWIIFHNNETVGLSTHTINYRTDWLIVWVANQSFQEKLMENKANLRDLIAATGLVILLKLDSNRRFFSPCDLGWPKKTIGHLFNATLSYLHHLVAIGELKLELQSRNA